MEPDELINVFKTIGVYAVRRGFGPGRRGEDVDAGELLGGLEADGYRLEEYGERGGATLVALLLPPFSLYLRETKRLLSAAVPALGRLAEGSEVLIVVPDDVYEKKQTALLEAVGGHVGGARLDVCPYGCFITDIPAVAGVPRHERLTPAEAEAFLAEARLRRAALPIMPYKDPASFWTGARPGELVRVVRPSVAAGESEAVYQVVGEA